MKILLLILALISFNLLGEDLSKTESFVKANYGAQNKGSKDLESLTNHLVSKNLLKKVKRLRCRYVNTKASKIYTDAVVLEVKNCESLYPFRSVKLPKIKTLFIFHIQDKNKFIGEFIENNKLFVIPKVAVSLDEEIAVKY